LEKSMENKPIDHEALNNILVSAAELIIQNKDELGRLDAAIGDGDHGVTMERVMNILIEKVEKFESTDMSALLQEIGWDMLCCDGGATGPLYGSLFLGMSDAIAGKSVLDGQTLARMFEGGMKSIMKQSKANIGDKTMMDALIPAVEAANEAASENKDISEILEAAAFASKAGSDFTATIPAHFGRAKFQGERTIGHPDPGSVSISLMFRGFANAFKSDD